MAAFTSMLNMSVQANSFFSESGQRSEKLMNWEMVCTKTTQMSNGAHFSPMSFIFASFEPRKTAASTSTTIPIAMRILKLVLPTDPGQLEASSRRTRGTVTGWMTHVFDGQGLHCPAAL